MAEGPKVENEVLCYIRSVRNRSTIIRQIQEAVINLFNQQAVHEEFHTLDFRGKFLTSRQRPQTRK